MTRRLRAVLVALLACAAPLLARPVFLGEPFPLTNTRYGEATGHPHLVSNGAEVFLFWATDTHIRFTRLGSDAPPSRAVMRRAGRGAYAVVWNGRYFVLVAAGAKDITGQLLDVTGEAVGAPFTIAQGDFPRIAFDGTSILMLYRRANGDVHAQLLSRDGVPAGESRATGLQGNVQSVASNGRSFAAVVAETFDRTLLTFARDGSVSTSAKLPDEYGGYWSTLASDGQRYLLVDAVRSPVYARLVSEDGTLGTPLVLDTARGWDFTGATVAWTGSKWIAAWAVSPVQLPGGVAKTFTIAQLDSDVRMVERREESSGVSVSLAALGDRLTVAWLPRVEYGDVIQVADLPLGGQTGIAASFAATRQTLHATASAQHGTLVLWEERGVLYSGIRSHDGRWQEHVAWPHFAYASAAATDGQEFAVALTTPEGWFVLRLDRDGKPLGDAVPITNMYPNQILWNGREFLLVGAWGNDTLVAPLNGTPRVLPLREDGVVLAAGDDGYLAAWVLTGPYQTPGGAPRLGVAGIRLDRDFRALDAQPLTFVLETSDAIYSAGAGWDGTQYVVAWSGDKGLFAAHVPAKSGAPVTRSVANDLLAGDLRVTRIAGGVALDWQHYGDGSGLPEKRLALLFSDGTATETLHLRSSTYPEIASLPGGEVAVVETLFEDDAAVEGTQRVTMSVLAQTPLPLRPRSPLASAVLHGDVAELRWAPPAQTVHGYRVEYRIADGPWIEIDRTLSPDDRSASIATHGRKIALRVRAWNEAGTGAYSQTVIVNGEKRRRAVR